MLSQGTVQEEDKVRERDGGGGCKVKRIGKYFVVGSEDRARTINLGM